VSSVREYRFVPFERVVIGRRAFAELPGQVERLGRRRALILAGGALESGSDLLERTERMLGERWAGTWSDVSERGAERGRKGASDRAPLAEADLIVSLGSGIDSARRAALELLGEGSEQGLPQIAIPTSLASDEFAPAPRGAGRAAGPAELRRRRARVPEVVLLDPEVTAATPARVWSFTGIEALGHAVECLWSPGAHPVTDTLALDAVRRLDRDLRASLDPDELEARLQCQIGAWMAAFGLLDVGVRLGSPLARQIGARFGVPLGVACGIALPPLMRFLAPRTLGAQARVAAALGIAGSGRSLGQLAALAGDAVEALIETLALPQRLREVGAERADLGEVARGVARELGRAGSPDAEPTSEARLLQLLEEMW
jgi:alcohol dehydrogenase